MEEENDFIECPNCGGQGWVIDVEIDMECCGWTENGGNCCNNPIPVQRQVQKLCNCYEGKLLK